MHGGYARWNMSQPNALAELLITKLCGFTLLLCFFLYKNLGEQALFGARGLAALSLRRMMATHPAGTAT